MGPIKMDVFRNCFIKLSDGQEIPLQVEQIDFNPCMIGPELTGYLLRGWKDNRSNDPIEKVIFNDPATIVIWKDKTKTVVKCQEGDIYSPELGLAMCISKKYLGNKGNFNEVFKKWIPEDVPVISGLLGKFKIDGEALGKAVSDTMYNLGKSLVRNYGPKTEPEKEGTRPEPEISVEKMREDLMYHCSYVGCCEKCSLDDVDTNCEFTGKNKAGDHMISDEDIRKYYKIIFNKEEK